MFLNVWLLYMGLLLYCNSDNEKWKIRKSGLVSTSRQENLADLFLVFPSRLKLKHDQKRFIRILSLSFPEMRSLGPF